MPRCKIDGCREPALPSGKRYCAEHKARYLQKQRAYELVRATLPDCTCCGQKLSQTATDQGKALCGHCEQENDQRQIAARRVEEFESASSVEELKEWMRKHLNLN